MRMGDRWNSLRVFFPKADFFIRNSEPAGTFYNTMPLVFVLPVAKLSEYQISCFLEYYTYWPNNNKHCISDARQSFNMNFLINKFVAVMRVGSVT